MTRGDGGDLDRRLGPDPAPEKFAFELVGGHLCSYVSGHKKDAAHLDTMRGATATVATRLREESTE